MSELNADYWSNRYQEGRTGWDIGYPSPQLIALANEFPKSTRILIPGAGNAYEAEELWNQGYTNTFVIDLAKEPLTSLKNRVPDFPDEHLLQGDFFDLKMPFDLILEQTFFCALDPSLREAYINKMADVLSENGTLGGLLFNHPLTEIGPPFGGSEEEYKTLFGSKFHLQNFAPSKLSIKPREGKEFFFQLRKKQ